MRIKINDFKHKILLLGNSFFKLQKVLADRILWPYSSEQNSLYRWRALILASILLSGLFFGFFALIPTLFLIVQENVWGLAIVDFTGVVLCLVFLFVHKIKFEIRALVTLLGFYVIGVAVILSVGPLSGGPAWLFAFAVLAGILMGNWGALAAILMNAVAFIIIGSLMQTGMLGNEFPFFNTQQAMITAVINFLVLNAITAVSVSALLKGLNTSEKKYSLLARNATDVIWTMDMDLNFTYISPSVYNMRGFTAKESLQKSLDENFLPESLKKILGLYATKIEQIEEGLDQAWEPAIFEAKQYCKDGTTIWVNIHARIIKGADNNPEGILGITRNITERKKNEQEKINAQIVAGEHKKLALVGQIAGKMAHDFNNILGIIMGVSELALMHSDDEDMTKNLKLIFNQTIRGRNLTKNLVAFAKSQEPKQNFFNINETIDLVLSLMKMDLENVELMVDRGGDIPEILADPGMIEHAMVNLLQNAIHATSMTKSPLIKIKTYCNDDEIFIEFEDNGCGIPKECINSIFEPSFTLKGSQDSIEAYNPDIKGTGYGLANVKKYIDQHNGNITVESAVDSGTKFTISMPVIKKELSVKEKKQIQNQLTQTEKQILLVEDEQIISDVQYKILTMDPCNHKVDIANTGQEAMDLFNKNQYDCISLDYILPGKINGMDIYKHIRAINQTIPILFISGNIEFLESIQELKQRDSYVDHLSKPCKNIEYINGIDSLMNRLHI